MLWQDAFAEPNMSVHDEEEETQLILWGENASESYILLTVRHLFIVFLQFSSLSETISSYNVLYSSTVLLVAHNLKPAGFDSLKSC